MGRFIWKREGMFKVEDYYSTLISNLRFRYKTFHFENKTYLLFWYRSFLKEHSHHLIFVSYLFFWSNSIENLKHKKIFVFCSFLWSLRKTQKTQKDFILFIFLFESLENSKNQKYCALVRSWRFWVSKFSQRLWVSKCAHIIAFEFCLKNQRSEDLSVEVCSKNQSLLESFNSWSLHEDLRVRIKDTIHSSIFSQSYYSFFEYDIIGKISLDKNSRSSTLIHS